MNLFDKYSKKIYKGAIILITNVINKTELYNEKSPNIIAEFFNDNEYDEILSAIKHNNYTVICYFDENKFISDYLNGLIKFKDFIVFNFARNGYGPAKKSLIPTFCDLNNIKYTASDGYACSFARQKYHVNALLKYLNINFIESFVYKDAQWLAGIKPNRKNTKYIVKPLFESASQGITDKSIITLKDQNSFDKRVLDIYNNLKKTPLLIQEFIEGYEAKTTIIEFDKPYVLDPVGVSINEIRNLKELIITNDIAFSYNHTNFSLREEMGDEIVEQIKKESLLIYESIGMANYGRIDCRINYKTRKIYYMDFSTMPYFVSNGEMIYALNQLGYNLNELINLLINSALISKYNYSL